MIPTMVPTRTEMAWWYFATVSMVVIAALECWGYLAAGGFDRLGFAIATIIYATSTFLWAYQRRTLRHGKRCWHG